MRLFSTAALSLALVATSGLIAPGAALAQKKGKEEAAAPRSRQSSRRARISSRSPSRCRICWAQRITTAPSA